MCFNFTSFQPFLETCKISTNRYKKRKNSSHEKASGSRQENVSRHKSRRTKDGKESGYGLKSGRDSESEKEKRRRSRKARAKQRKPEYGKPLLKFRILKSNQISRSFLLFPLSRFSGIYLDSPESPRFIFLCQPVYVQIWLPKKVFIRLLD